MDTKPETPRRCRRPRRRAASSSATRTASSTTRRTAATSRSFRSPRWCAAGEEVQIIDNNTKDDLTEVTLAQIIYEEQKAHARSVPLQTLKELIHARTEKVLADLREGPIGRLIPGGARPGRGEGRGRRRRKDVEADAGRPGQGEARGVAAPIDERVKAVLPSFRPLQQLQQEVKRLTSVSRSSSTSLKGAEPERRLTGGLAPGVATTEGIGRRRGLLPHQDPAERHPMPPTSASTLRKPMPSPRRRSRTSTRCTASPAS